MIVNSKVYRDLREERLDKMSLDIDPVKSLFLVESAVRNVGNASGNLPVNWLPPTSLKSIHKHKRKVI